MKISDKLRRSEYKVGNFWDTLEEYTEKNVIKT